MTLGRLTISVTVQWYLKEEQPWINSIWFSMFGVANLISSLLAYGFYYIKRSAGLAGWQWMTLTMSLISFVASGKSLVSGLTTV